MNAIDLLPFRPEQPRDAYEWTDADATFDSALYRLGLRILVPVPGLDSQLEVGGVRVSLVRGPIRAQRTELRQRYGLPVVFDKHMSRAPHGAGELVLLLSLETAVSDVGAIERAVLSWRARVEAAAGALVALLDERVAGERVLEDVVLLRAGNAVAGADLRARVAPTFPST